MSRAAKLSLLLLAACDAELDLSPERFACGSGGPCDEADGGTGDQGPVDGTPRDSGRDAGRRDSGADAGPIDLGPIVCNSGPAGAWRRITADVGEARAGHSMVYDSVANVSVIYGGRGTDNRLMGMSFGAANLFEIPPRGPERAPATTGHSAAITGDRRVFVFGGRSSAGMPLSETWSFDLTLSRDPSWDRDFDAAYQIEGHQAVMADKMYVPGGCVPEAISEVGTLNLQIGTWLSEIVLGFQPPGRCEYSAVVLPNAMQIVVFGGKDSSTFDETWLFDFDRAFWVAAPIRGPAPPARWGHTAVVDTVNDRMIVFGGTGADGQPRNDLWALSFANWCWEELSSGATPRKDHAMVWARDRIFLYGGDNAGALSDVWEVTF